MNDPTPPKLDPLPENQPRRSEAEPKTDESAPGGYLIPQEFVAAMKSKHIISGIVTVPLKRWKWNPDTQDFEGVEEWLAEQRAAQRTPPDE